MCDKYIKGKIKHSTWYVTNKRLCRARLSWTPRPQECGTAPAATRTLVGRTSPVSTSSTPPRTSATLPTCRYVVDVGGGNKQGSKCIFSSSALPLFPLRSFVGTTWTWTLAIYVFVQLWNLVSKRLQELRLDLSWWTKDPCGVPLTPHPLTVTALGRYFTNSDVPLLVNYLQKYNHSQGTNSLEEIIIAFLKNVLFGEIFSDVWRWCMQFKDQRSTLESMILN